MARTRLADRTDSVSSDGDQLLSTETVFDTLSNRRRRYALHHLKRVDGSVTIRELSEQLAAWENGIDCRHVTPKERKRLYTALHQTHLPKMDQLGVVHYDRNRGVVELTEAISQFDIYFDLVGKDDVPWSQFYLALGVGLTAVVALAVLDVGPFGAVDGAVYGLGGALAFTAVALCHVVRDRVRVLGSADEPPEPIGAPVAVEGNDERIEN